jgi:hypothetical protein
MSGRPQFAEILVMRSPQTPNVWPKLCQSSWGTGDGWPFLFLQSVRHTHLSETAVKSEDGEFITAVPMTKLFA